MIRIKNIEKDVKLGKVPLKILKGINLDIKSGEVVVILGPSGSGKSTLLNVLSGLDEDITTGTIDFMGNKLEKMSAKQLTKFRKENIGFIFQKYYLLPHLNVNDNIMVGLSLSDNPLSLQTIIDTLDLSEHKNKLPHQLSGGQQQRVAIARAITKNPKVLFCDEPTGALDEPTGKEVLKILQKINREYGTTIIMVTHNRGISTMANKVVYMNSGRIEKVVENTTIVEAEEVVWS